MNLFPTEKIDCFCTSTKNLKKNPNKMNIFKRKILQTSSKTLTINFGLLFTCVCLLFFVDVGFISSVQSVRPPVPVVINKCCRIGEQLDQNDQKCLFGGTEQWWPLIYLILKQTYYVPHGEAPRFLKVREQARPICDSPELFTGNNNMAVFSNGTLFLSEKNVFVDADNYCVDKDSAMVCFPQPKGVNSLVAPVKKNKIRKCCGLQFVYTENSKCSLVEEGHKVLSKKLIENSTAFEFVFGFPKCKTSNDFTIVGQFDESNLEHESGNLTLSGREFKWDEYCLEHTLNDSDSSYVNVFTCAEHFSVPDAIAAPNDQEVCAF